MRALYFGFKPTSRLADSDPMQNRIFASLFAGLFLSLGLVGCATQDAAWVHENLTLTENFHAGTMVLETPAFPEAKPHLAQLRATARSRGSRIGADVELTVRAEFADYSFLDRVSFASGRAFPLEVVKREPEDCGTTDKSLCNVHEYVAVKLSREFLKSKEGIGFHAKLWGRRDSVVINVPPEFIEGLLAKMENRAPNASPVAGSPVPAQTQNPGPAAPAPSGGRR